MDRRLYPGMFLLVGVLIGLAASGRIMLRAQEREKPAARVDVNPAVDPVPPPSERAERGTPSASVQDVLLRTYHFPFDRPTSLSRVCLHLKQTLGVPVVLDIAALDRQDVKPEDTVQLELNGVRLKTGLKLLLDQVGLTYHVVPDDNLLIITDREGSDDPLDRIWTELRNLHRDLHDVQDAVDELSDALYGEVEEGPRVRKPTIIEEKPEADRPDAELPGGGEKTAPKAPGQKPGRPQNHDRPGGASKTPSRVPLARPGRSL